MAITLDIRPEVEAELARQAELTGRAVETYAAELLEDAIRLPASEAAPAESLEQVFAKVRGLMTDEEIDTLFSRNPSVSRPVKFD